MKPHKTDTCAFTAIRDNSEMKPVGDDHDTLLYRGLSVNASNEAGGSVDQYVTATQILTRHRTQNPTPQLG